MKRIIAISTLAVAACVGFSSVANAADPSAISTQSGTVAATCSVTGTDSTTTTPTTSNINGVDFPTAITLTGGKFTTLCNTASSTIKVEKNAAPTVPTGTGAQTGQVVTYDLSGSGTVYSAVGFLTTGIGIDTIKTGTAVHSYSTIPSDLTVAVKVAAPPTQILQNGTYTVVLKATLTP
jgi:hypothetical protein